MSKNSFGREQRLSGKKRIEELFESGRGEFVYPFRYLYRVDTLASPHSEVDPQQESSSKVTKESDSSKSPAENGAAMLISVPKRIHKGAVVRNKLKRRTREAYRKEGWRFRAKLEEGERVEIAFIYVAKDVESYSVIENGVKKIISKICKGL